MSETRSAETVRSHARPWFRRGNPLSTEGPPWFPPYTCEYCFYQSTELFEMMVHELTFNHSRRRKYGVVFPKGITK